MPSSLVAGRRPTSCILRLKIALWVGLIVGAPVWLYQLWAFVAPGLHQHERKWAYVFVAIAAPLFAAGAVLAYFVVEHSLASSWRPASSARPPSSR